MTTKSQDRAGLKAMVQRIARFTRSSDDAEEFLQSAFIRLIEYRSRHAVENETAFLVRTAMNIAVDESRRRRVRAEPDVPMELLIEISDEQPLQDEVIVAQERLKVVQAALERLSPRTREIYLMHRVDGMKYREIAAELGITMSAVEKHIAKASMFLTERFQLR
jgi:RNA polymerase sigma-70 factor (ECF subfamily)